MLPTAALMLALASDREYGNVQYTKNAHRKGRVREDTEPDGANCDRALMRVAIDDPASACKGVGCGSPRLQVDQLPVGQR